jgi:ribonucleoside-diphosphate reductase alpha chain
MYKVREKNRRLGLGLMGIHEWLLRRGYKYGPNQELEKWLQAYERASDYAKYWASNVFGISVPVKTRAVAPTGTISIVAETTSGLEPIFAAAQKRRYMSQDNSKNWCYQYIIDACAERLISDGVDPDSIEDAYDLAEDIERRVEMQSWIQRYVDHSISSTINMPSWGSSCNNPNTVDSFGKTLYKYLPKLRGITVYPDGARGGQPLNRVSYAEAIKHIGKEFTESGESVSVKTEEFGNERSCVNGLCGI